MTTMITVYLLMVLSGSSTQKNPVIIDRYSTRENCETAQRVLPQAIIRTHCVAHKVEVLAGAERVK